MNRVAIIGAGPAGISCALTLLKHDVNCTVFDKDMQSLVIPETFVSYDDEVINELGISSLIDKCLTDASKLVFTACDGNSNICISGTFKSNSGSVNGIDRSKLNRTLIEFAEQCGVQVVQRNIQSIKSVQKGSYVLNPAPSMSDDSISDVFDFVVDSTGKLESIQHELSHKDKCERLDDRQGYFSQFEGSHGLESSTNHIVSLERAYIYLIPINENRLTVGIAVYESCGEDPKGIFYKVIEQSSWVSSLVSSLDRLMPVVPVINNISKALKITDGHIYLAGDAIGFSDPFFSSGIRKSIHCGWHAGNAIAQTLHLRNVEVSNEVYRDELELLYKGIEEKTGAVLQESVPNLRMHSLADPHVNHGIQKCLLDLVAGHHGDSSLFRVRRMAESDYAMD